MKIFAFDIKSFLKILKLKDLTTFIFNFLIIKIFFLAIKLTFSLYN